MARSHDISPAYDATAITPTDGTGTQFQQCRALYIGTTGNLVVEMASGNQVTLNSVPVGIIDIQVHRVLATGTTATNIVALY